MSDRSQVGSVRSVQQSEEGIKVAIRVRPLECSGTSSDANSGDRVWRVLKKHNSITQTTSTGQPLSDRILNRTFFTFDKTFGENVSTEEVYDDVAKGIVDSVVNGLNGTIFAYGQTSSGKTYTMQGSGGYGGMIDSEHSYEENQAPGIVHIAARDIFDHIEKSSDRVFLLKVSYVEIYNEEVRDLLVSGDGESSALRVREDSRGEVFINANENIVTSFTGLLDALFAGEKHRSVASTLMNERSSRSHTIFRIIVESRKKSTKSEADDESEIDGDYFEEDDDTLSKGTECEDGSSLRSILNLVDLAGSESVRHTRATGERMKEGAKINQSLLTLSRVMVGLGDPNHGHINFRDSKLTRILQPSLSGNARMAVVCCATPSHLYLEETRSTLQFASRAKLVKTNAKINEVIDDRSMIKKLKREVKEMKNLLNEQSSDESRKLAKEREMQLHQESIDLLGEKQELEREIQLKNIQMEDIKTMYRQINEEKTQSVDEVNGMQELIKELKGMVNTLANEKKEALEENETIRVKMSNLKEKNIETDAENLQLNLANKQLKLEMHAFANNGENGFGDIDHESVSLKSPQKTYGSLLSESSSEKVSTLGDIELSTTNERKKVEYLTNRVRKLEMALLEAAKNKDDMREEILNITSSDMLYESKLSPSSKRKKEGSTQTDSSIPSNFDFDSSNGSFCGRKYFGFYFIMSIIKSKFFGSRDVGEPSHKGEDLQQKFI